MTAFNVVRFKSRLVEKPFLDAYPNIAWPRLRRANMIRTGEGRYCLVAEWESTEAGIDSTHL